MRLAGAMLLACAACGPRPARAQALSPFQRVLPPGFVDEVMESTFKAAPTTILPLPDGRFMLGFLDGKAHFWTSKDGLTERPFIDSKLDFQVGTEDGVNGAVLDPAYATNHWLYVFYVTRREEGPPAVLRMFKIVRFTVAPEGETPDGIVPGSEKEIITFPDENQYTRFHVGGGLSFGPDGKIYAGFGEDGSPPCAQNPVSMRGKMLRMNPDGTAPDDNPLFGGKRTYAYALGLRNPYRNFWDAKTGQHFCCDTGQALWEEFNLVEAGGNYGWPLIDGPMKDNPGVKPPPNYHDPFFYYPHGRGEIAGSSIVAGLVYTGTMFPVEYRGDIFLTEWGLYGNSKMFRLRRNADASFKDVTLFQRHQVDFGMADITQAGDGSIYYLLSHNHNNTGAIRRLSYVAPDAPPQVKIAAGVRKGIAPLQVAFKAEVKDEGTPALMWEFGDGSSALQFNPMKSYTTGGKFKVRLTAMDIHGSKGTDETIIDVTQPADAKIHASVYDAGEAQIKPAKGRARLVDRTGEPLPLAGAPEVALGDGGKIEAESKGLQIHGALLYLEIEADGCAPRRVPIPIIGGKADFGSDVFVSPIALVGRVATDSGDPVANNDLWLNLRREDGGLAPYELPDGQDAQPPLSPSGVRNGSSSGADGGFYLPLRRADMGRTFQVVANAAKRKAGHMAGSFEVAAPSAVGAADTPIQLVYVSGGQGCDTILPPNNSRVEMAEVQKVFDNYCVGCHGLISPYQGLTLTDGFAYSNLLERLSGEVPTKKLLDQSSSKDKMAESYLMEKVNCSLPSVGSSMPPTGKISGGERNLLSLWIRGGAADDKRRISMWASQQEGTSPMTVQFRGGADGPRPNFAIHKGPAFQFKWEFSDGTTSDEPNPLKTFTLPPGAGAGQILASLTVLDWKNASLGSRTMAIKIAPAAP